MNPVKFLIGDAIERIKTQFSEMAAPTNDSRAIKIAAYQISENGQVFAGFITNTMTHNGADWGELEELQLPFGSLTDDTFNDANGTLQTCHSSILALPIGWTHNHARISTQVEGVDL
jgi:hypothetical protein